MKKLKLFIKEEMDFWKDISFKEFILALKESIKEDWKFYLFLISFAIICLIPVDYYIVVGGGINDISNRIEVEDESESSGSYNLSYVKELNGTVLTFTLSYIIPSWERVETGDYKYNDNETTDDIDFRSELDLKNANTLAVVNAYGLANKDYKINGGNFFVIFVSDEYDTDFKIQDQIVSINGVTLKEVSDFRRSLIDCEFESKVDVKIIRDDKEMVLSSTVYELNGNRILGVGLNYYYDMDMTPKTEFKFKKSERGPSAGLMTTLALYDKLVKEDISRGLKIAGTGTIEADGSIGKIGGVRYKIIGADDGGADIFLVPKDNLDEALKVKKEKKLDIDIYGVSTFKEAIEVLEKL